jgi:hypothetical protein
MEMTRFFGMQDLLCSMELSCPSDKSGSVPPDMRY